MGDRTMHESVVLDGLSPVERDYLSGLVAGESEEGVVTRLNLDSAEASSVRQSLMTKLGASRTVDAVREGIRAGL